MPPVYYIFIGTWVWGSLFWEYFHGRESRSQRRMGLSLGVLDECIDTLDFQYNN